jgi:hypothetical protein
MVYWTVFIGMFAEHLIDKDPYGPVSLYGVGVMVRSQEIKAALMTEELRADRLRRYRKHKQEGTPL